MLRWLSVLLASLVVGSVLAPAAPAAAAPAAPATDAPATPTGDDPKPAENKKDGDKCSLTDTAVGSLPVIGVIAKGDCTPLGQVLDKAGVPNPGDVVKDVVSDAASSAFDGFVEKTREGARWVTEQVTKSMLNSSTPNLRDPNFLRRYQPMLTLGAALALLVFVLAVMPAAFRGDGRALGETLIGAARAGIGTGAALALAEIAIQVTDSMTEVIIGTPIDAADSWKAVAGTYSDPTLGQEGLPAFIALLIALVQILAAGAAWLEMQLREGVLYIVVLFFPVVLAAAIKPSLVDWLHRLIKLFIVALLLKPMLTAILALAAALVGSGFEGVITALVVFILAAFAPMFLLAVITLDPDTARQMAGIHGAGRAALTSAGASSARGGRTIASKAASGGRQLGSSMRGGGGRNGGATLSSGKGGTAAAGGQQRPGGGAGRRASGGSGASTVAAAGGRDGGGRSGPGSGGRSETPGSGSGSQGATRNGASGGSTQSGASGGSTQSGASGGSTQSGASGGSTQSGGSGGTTQSGRRSTAPASSSSAPRGGDGAAGGAASAQQPTASPPVRGGGLDRPLPGRGSVDPR